MYKICVVTSTRADYGILKPLIKALQNTQGIELTILVTGTHLEKAYGHTIDEIKEDGFNSLECIEIIADDSLDGLMQTMANAITKVGQSLKQLSPDIVILLGDRYEIFAIASACTLLNLSIAHIGGGELTAGAIDEVFRHSITKMSSLHFTSCEEYRKRVIQLGELPQKVYNVGSLSLQEIHTLDFYTKEELDKEFNIDCQNTILFTFHPLTKEVSSQKEQYIQVLEALVESPYTILATRSNADTNASIFNKILDEYAAKYKEKFRISASLGIRKYMSMMKYAACVLGNSSSGILEAPSFQLPTINIGNRQKGRIQAPSVIQCDAEKKQILAILENLPSRESLKTICNPYEKANTKEEIIAALLNFLQNKEHLQSMKEFYTLKH